jgi:uncharacterized protein (TIGR01244 family)
MDIKQVEHDYSVGAQIAESDLAALAGAGFKTVIDNRPDAEIETGLHAQFMEAEATRLGLKFVYNPISNQGMTMQNLEDQASAIAGSGGPVFAYCRSGMRSTICWSLINARRLSVDEIIASAAGAGYALDNMRPQIEAMAQA